MKNNINQRKITTLEKILAPFGIVAIFGFPLASLFFGIVDININCNRSHVEEFPTCEIHDRRFFGLYNDKAIAYQVRGIGYKTGNVSTNSRTSFASTVVMAAANGEIPLTKVLSSLGGNWKKESIRKVDEFLINKSQPELKVSLKEISIFGWIGIVICGFFVLSYAGAFYSWLDKKIKTK